jgi:hypothetical protein
MKIHEIENKAWSMDGVRIIIRGPENENLMDYTQKNATQANWSVTKYIETRIKPLVGDKEVTVLLGNGELPHGNTLLSSVRNSYKK